MSGPTPATGSYLPWPTSSRPKNDMITDACTDLCLRRQTVARYAAVSTFLFSATFFLQWGRNTHEMQMRFRKPALGHSEFFFDNMNLRSSRRQVNSLRSAAPLESLT